MRRAEVNACGRRTERAFVERGLAEDYRAGRAQARHRGGIGRDRAAPAGQTGASGEAGDVEVVLDRNRKAVEPADRATLATPRGARRGGGRCARVELDVGVEARILAFDRGAMDGEEVLAVDAAGGEPAQHLERAGAAQHRLAGRVCYFFRHAAPRL